MRLKIIAVSLFAVGMATSAFAQSNPAPAGATIDKSTVDTGGGANGDVKKPMSTDTSTTGSTAAGGTMGAMGTMDKANCKDPASSGGTGKLQTQGGKSNATPEDEACAAHNN